VLHFHVLLGNVGLLRYPTAHELWREGFSWIEPARNGDAVRAYVAKYTSKGGEVEVGGAGISEPLQITRAPPRWYARSLVRRALAQLNDEEREHVMHWTTRDRRPSTRPDELLARMRSACERPRSTEEL
jgi:hypothetical protein